MTWISVGRNANGSLRGLRDVPDMALLGGFVQYSPADFWRVYAQLGQAVSVLLLVRVQGGRVRVPLRLMVTVSVAACGVQLTGVDQGFDLPELRVGVAGVLAQNVRIEFLRLRVVFTFL